ncbi:MAG: hypothetical protein ACREAL_01925 [Nitrosopumilaceae archaeon]
MKSKPILLIATISIIAAIVTTSTFNGMSIASAENNLRDDSDTIIPLKEAKLIIEHNAKDEDTGFQGFIDSEGWNKITLTGPKGKVLDFKATGMLGKLGLTELFFETVEPANADVPIAEVLKTLPAGKYMFTGSAIEAGEKKGKTIGTAWLTHVIPAGPVLLSPAENAVVSPVEDDLLVSWSPVDKTIEGFDVDIISYQLIIEKDETPHPNMIGKLGLSIYLPASVTQITIPKEFLEPGTDYNWEVLAIEESGNQTLMSGTFSTEE